MVIIIIVTIIGIAILMFWEDKNRSEQINGFCLQVKRIIERTMIDHFYITHRHSAINKTYSLCMYYGGTRYKKNEHYNATFRVPQTISGILFKLTEATGFDYVEIYEGEINKYDGIVYEIPAEAYPIDNVYSSFTRTYRFSRKDKRSLQDIKTQ